MLHGPGACTQAGTEPSLVPTEGTLDLPPLAEVRLTDATLHLATVRRRRPAAVLAPAAAFPRRDQRRSNAPFFAATPVVVFGVVSLVAEQLVDGLVGDGLFDGRRQLRRVLARPLTDERCEHEVRRQIADDRDLGPRKAHVARPEPPNEVLADVPALEPRGVDCSSALLRQQSSPTRFLNQGSQQGIERPP